MKSLGIILIVVGLAMVIIRGFSVQTEKKVLDIGPVEVNKTEHKWIGWPTYAGAIVAVVGVFLVIGDRKKAA
jgi:drug/metabolite transporter (DMT)-like permease